MLNRHYVLELYTLIKWFWCFFFNSAKFLNPETCSWVRNTCSLHFYFLIVRILIATSV